MSGRPQMIRDLERALAKLVEINARVISSRKVPPLATAGVRLELADVETWRTIPVMLEHLVGDAEDFAAWRAAELQAEGLAARVVVFDRGDGALTVAVETSTGLEDPTRFAASPAAARRGGRR